MQGRRGRGTTASSVLDHQVGMSTLVGFYGDDRLHEWEINAGMCTGSDGLVF
jgi:hypothetical protein